MTPKFPVSAIQRQFRKVGGDADLRPIQGDDKGVVQARAADEFGALGAMVLVELAQAWFRTRREFPFLGPYGPDREYRRGTGAISIRAFLWDLGSPKIARRDRRLEDRPGEASLAAIGGADGLLTRRDACADEAGSKLNDSRQRSGFEEIILRATVGGWRSRDIAARPPLLRGGTS